MKLRAADRARAGIPWRCCAMSLAGLLIVVALSACSGGGKPSCTGGSEDYHGRCLPPVTVQYLGCIEGRGFSYSNELSGSATLPAVADSTFTVAYKRSKEEDSTAALKIVHDCLTLAKGTRLRAPTVALPDIMPSKRLGISMWYSGGSPRSSLIRRGRSTAALPTSARR